MSEAVSVINHATLLTHLRLEGHPKRKGEMTIFGRVVMLDPDMDVKPLGKVGASSTLEQSSLSRTSCRVHQDISS